MKYHCIKEGIFKERPNRFIAYVSLEGQTVTCHVKNTGRCKELLICGCKVLLEYHADAAALGRKTEYSLIGVYKHTAQGDVLINMDSQAPNQVAQEWLLSEDCVAAVGGTPLQVRREVTYGQSRFDLAFELDGRRAYMEVKGVTLEADGIARFPDAPTERGVKHIHELIHAAKEGHPAFILFVIQMTEIYEFQPNMTTHPAFGDALKDASGHGVHILAYDCSVQPDSLVLQRPVAVNLL